MVLGLALPKRVYLEPTEVAVTFVVPAPNGCNMACAFCAIRARGEAKPEEIRLGKEDYRVFLRAAAATYQVGVVSIQGYEPLLPESWSYTRMLVEEANALGLKTSLVTNGVNLSAYAAELAALRIGSLTVSIDSADSTVHDQSRGVQGAFQSVMKGLTAALQVGLRDQITIASVMQRQKAHLLDGMPAMLVALGLDRWVVTPVQSFGTQGGTVDRADYILSEGKRLYIKSLESGIKFELDDELEAIVCPTERERLSVESLLNRRIQRAEQIIRVSPSGVVSRGSEIRSRVTSASMVWDPSTEGADDIVRRLQAAKPRPNLQLVKT